MGRAVITSLLVLMLCYLGCAQETVRVCIPMDKPPAYEAQCAKVLNDNLGPTLKFSCVSGGSSKNCADAIVEGRADLANFGGEELYNAGVDSKLVPVVGEDYGAGDSSEYYGIALTTKAYCDTQGTTLQSLKGKRSCHTGFRKTSGWTIPVGYLVRNGIAPVVSELNDVTNDAETVANFFGNVCAPRTTADGPRAGGQLWEDGLCNSCAGTGSTKCTEDDPYYDYLGAFKCLADGAGDVAFVKHTTPLEYANNGLKPNDATGKPITNLSKANFRLMCPSGECLPVEDWASCNLGKAAAHAFMARPDWAASATGKAVIAALAAKGTTNSTLLRQGIELGGEPNFLFSKSTVELLPVTETFNDFFGAPSVEAYGAIRALEVEKVRWCTTSPEDTEFCEKATAIMNAKKLGAEFSCVQRADDHDCLEAIRSGAADMRTFDGADIHMGNRDYDLKVIVGEDYGLSAAMEYYAVAVVDKDFCTSDKVNFADLKGKRSCHTGFRKTAGWQMPVGYMLSSGIMPVVRNNAGVTDDAESVVAFFSEVCAPRVADDGPATMAGGKGALWQPMCATCAGDCSATKAEPYQDYAGAFRCLHDNKGDVAFIKHTTVAEFAADGSAPDQEGWATRNMDDFRLLCPSGGCAPVNQYFRCNVAKVPSHGVLTRSSYGASKVVKAALVAASADAEFAALVFNGTTNPNSYMFKSSTTGLLEVNDDTKTFLSNALPTYQSMEDLLAGNEPVITQEVPRAAGGGGGSDLSGGAIAGIVIGACAGTALLAALAFTVFHRRSKASWTKYPAEGDKAQFATNYGQDAFTKV